MAPQTERRANALAANVSILDTDDDALSALSFEFDIGAIDENTTVFIDPEIAVGCLRGEGEVIPVLQPTSALFRRAEIAAGSTAEREACRCGFTAWRGYVYEVQVGGANGPTAVEPGAQCHLPR